MKKIGISWDEMYPDYSIYDVEQEEPIEKNTDYVFEVPEKTYKRWKEAITKYNQAQMEMHDLVCKRDKELFPPKKAGPKRIERKIYRKRRNKNGTS